MNKNQVKKDRKSQKPAPEPGHAKPGDFVVMRAMTSAEFKVVCPPKGKIRL